MGSANLLDARGPRWLNMVGRLAPAQSVSAANDAAAAVFARLAAEYPNSNRGRTFNVVPLGTGPGVRASTGPLLRLLTWAVIAVLLIACANGSDDFKTETHQSAAAISRIVTVFTAQDPHLYSGRA